MVFVAELQTLLVTSLSTVYVNCHLYNFRTGIELKASAFGKQEKGSISAIFP